jgi:superfamily II DNA or RNA helicase
LIVDDCHHVSARRFQLVARRAKAKYVRGCLLRLPARMGTTSPGAKTPKRSDRCQFEFADVS